MRIACREVLSTEGSTRATAYAASVDDLLKKWGAKSSPAAEPEPSEPAAAEEPDATEEPAVPERPKPKLKPSPAAKGAFEGFGAKATGGKGKPVVVVKSASGFKSAAAGSNRHIKFGFSGNVPAGGMIMRGQNVTLDGFSAPSPGVTISGMLIIAGNGNGPDATGSNLVLQGLRFRKGSDCLRVGKNPHDLAIDHCSFSQAGDGSLDITEGSFNVTVSWCIIARTAGAGKANLISYAAHRVSVHHTIYHANNQRNPLVTNPPRTCKGPKPTSPYLDFRYNVIWQYW